MTYRPSPERLRELVSYNPETGKFRWLPRQMPYGKSTRAWGPKDGCWDAFTSTDEQNYLRGKVDKASILAHRAAWAIFYNEWPDGEIDHINCDRQDNRIENLRIVSRVVNCRNKRLFHVGLSGVVGVTKVTGADSWQATIRGNDGRKLHLGSYPSRELAHAARKGAEIALGYNPLHGTPFETGEAA